MIATLLLGHYTQLGLSKYAYNLLGMVAAGQATLPQMLPVLYKRQRERDLEKARLARKKAAKKSA